MSTHETAWESGETAAVALAPEAGMFASADAAGLGESTLAVFRRAAGQPAAAASAASFERTEKLRTRLSKRAKRRLEAVFLSVRSTGLSVLESVA